MSSLQKASLVEIRNAAARICGDYLNGKWKEVQPDELIVKRISGGLSNFLYYVALPEPKCEEPNNFGLDNAVDKHSTAIKIDQDSYEDIDGLTGATVGKNDRKRRRTESSRSGENFATFACRRHAEQTSEPKQVLLRIYGQSHGEDALEAMITESVVFALLSERNFGPKLHGIFPGGRIEQYIPARALTTLELSDERISKKIAEKLGEIHSLNIPMSKEPDWIWNCMDRWLISVNTILKEDTKYKHREHAKTVLTFDFAAEGRWLRSVIDNGKYPVAFCHNDMQEGNILLLEHVKHFSNFRLRDPVISLTVGDNVMEDCSSDSNECLKRKRSHFSSLNNNANNMSLSSYNIENEIDNTRDSAYSMTSSSFATIDEECDQDKEPNLMIIDFEYCAYNYRGFDLANHFLEWTFDYTNPEYPFYHHYKTYYPTEKQRQLFISSYLCKLNASVPGYEPTVEEIENVQCEVRVLSMLSHLFWSLWSIVNLSSNIEFGYWEYAVSRMQEYRKLKLAYSNTDIRTTQSSTNPEFNMIE